MVLLIVAIFKVERAHEAGDDQFFFHNIQNNEILETFKMFKNNH